MMREAKREDVIHVQERNRPLRRLGPCYLTVYQPGWVRLDFTEDGTRMLLYLRASDLIVVAEDTNTAGETSTLYFDKAPGPTRLPLRAANIVNVFHAAADCDQP